MKVLTVTKEGGVIYHGINVYTGIVEDQADLENVPEDAEAGSRFHTAGYANELELGLDGNWTEINPAPENNG